MRKVFHCKMASGETIGYAMLGDIGKGDTGDSYTMDGRWAVFGSGWYTVGGATEGIVLKKEELQDRHVLAAAQLLREVATDDMVMGFWFNGTLCFFDNSNIVFGLDEAMAMANERKEQAIWDCGEKKDVDTVYKTGKVMEKKAAGCNNRPARPLAKSYRSLTEDEKKMGARIVASRKLHPFE